METDVDWGVAVKDTQSSAFAIPIPSPSIQPLDSVKILFREDPEFEGKLWDRKLD